MIEHRHQVFRRNIELYVVNRAEDEASSWGKIADAAFHFGSYLFRGSVRQHVLTVAPATPEGEPVAEFLLEFSRIHTGG